MVENVNSGINFSVLHLNIPGLCSSLNDLKPLIDNSSPQIIGLCETFPHKGNDMFLDNSSTVIIDSGALIKSIKLTPFQSNLHHFK